MSHLKADMIDAPPRSDIIQVGLSYVPDSGGTKQAMDDFARAISAFSISFTVSSQLPPFSERDTDRVLHIPCDGIAGRYFAWSRSPLLANRAEFLLQQSRLVICHQLFRYHIQWATSIARRNRIPYWVVPHGILDPYVFSYRSLQKKFWMYLFGRRILSEAAWVVFATERERSKAMPYLEGVNSKVVHWPTEYVDTSRRDEARIQVRERYQIPSDDRLLIFLGRLHPLKRPLEIIEAVHISGQDNLHLLMVGPDSDVLSQNRCKEFCSQLGVKRVHFSGPIYGNEKYDYLMAADGYINLSLRENFGYSVAEALATGLPVILSPGNDLSPELAKVDCGWMLHSIDSSEVVSVIGEFAKASLMRWRRWELEGSPGRELR